MFPDHHPIDTTSSHLQALELDPHQFNNLSKEQQRQKILEHWTYLCFTHHPRNDPSNYRNYSHFYTINAAYNTLTNSASPQRSHIDDYFSPITVIIPDTAFDLTQQEAIETRYQELKLEFSCLSTEEQKQAFIQKYLPFLNLAFSLAQRRTELNCERANYYHDRQTESFSNHVIREWRTLMIRIFGEEYLSDFQYRHAIATGELWPILATHKLCSPIKLIVATLSTIILALNASTNAVFKCIYNDILADLNRISPDDDEFFLFSLKISILIYLVGALQPITFLLFNLPKIAMLLECIASPMSRVVRPLATRMQCSNAFIAMTLFIAGSMLAYAFIYTSLLAYLTVLLPYLSVALSIRIYYELAILTITLYHIHPVAGIVQGLILAMQISSGISMLQTHAAPLSFNEERSFFLRQFATNIATHSMNQRLANNFTTMADEMASLPLPKEIVPQPIIDATLLGCDKATLSHRLFNTPKNAPCKKGETTNSREFTHNSGTEVNISSCF